MKIGNLILLVTLLFGGFIFVEMFSEWYFRLNFHNF